MKMIRILFEIIMNDRQLPVVVSYSDGEGETEVVEEIEAPSGPPTKGDHNRAKPQKQLTKNQKKNRRRKAGKAKASRPKECEENTEDEP